MLEVIKLYYTYNTWSMGQLLNALAQLSNEEYTAPGCSGHGSIRDTLAHCLSTQQGWFSWFDKSKTPAESMAIRITGMEIDTIEKAKEKWSAIKKQTDNCLSALTNQRIQEVWTASLPNGFTMSLPLWQMLLHVVNHGTHTRAQIVSAVRRFEHNPGNLEFFRFALEQHPKNPT